MRYIGNIYRPPSEAYSLIVQMTVGCSHNRCAFCDMYTDKHFFVRSVEDVLADFAWCRRQYRHIGRVFLADGDALMASSAGFAAGADLYPPGKPRNVSGLPAMRRPKSIRLKTDEELRALRAANLQMVYMGLESGSDAVLRRMRKGCSAEQIVAAAQKARSANIALSVTAISGLGGRELWEEHAEQTGRALSAMKAEYIGLLTLMVEPGDSGGTSWARQGSLTLLTPREVLEETYMLLEHTDSEGSVFRMNHASNYLNLRGTLNRDRPAMLRQLRAGMEGSAALKDENWRAL